MALWTKHILNLLAKIIYILSINMYVIWHYYCIKMCEWNSCMKSSVFCDVNAIESSESQLTFQWNTLPSSSGLMSEPSEKPAWSRQQAEPLVTCLDYSSTLKIDAVCSSETLVNIYRTIWCHISEDCMYSSSFSWWELQIQQLAKFPEIPDSTPLAGSLKSNFITCYYVWNVRTY
jgi:hypothetical protein